MTSTENPTIAFGANGVTTRGAIVTVEGFELALLRSGTYREVCPACAGTGYRPGYEHVDGGRCWPCRYTGLGPMVGDGGPVAITKLMKRRQADRARRAAKKLAAQQAEAAAHTAWLDANPAVRAAADAVHATPREGARGTVHSRFVFDLADDATVKILTDKQVAAFLAGFAQEQGEIAAKSADLAARTWIGEVDAKITFTATVTFTYTSENTYGTSTLYRMVTAEGQALSWWRSGYHQVDKGAVLTITAKVKEHKDSAEYGKETVVTRGKIAA